MATDSPPPGKGRVVVVLLAWFVAGVVIAGFLAPRMGMVALPGEQGRGTVTVAGCRAEGGRHLCAGTLRQWQGPTSHTTGDTVEVSSATDLVGDVEVVGRERRESRQNKYGGTDHVTVSLLVPADERVLSTTSRLLVFTGFGAVWLGGAIMLAWAMHRLGRRGAVGEETAARS